MYSCTAYIGLIFHSMIDNMILTGRPSDSRLRTIQKRLRPSSRILPRLPWLLFLLLLAISNAMRDGELTLVFLNFCGEFYLVLFAWPYQVCKQVLFASMLCCC